MIATTAGGLNEQVIDGHTGFIATPENPVSLAAALRRGLALTAAERRRIRDNTHHFATARYDYPLAVRVFLAQVASWIQDQPGGLQSTYERDSVGHSAGKPHRCFAIRVAIRACAIPEPPQASKPGASRNDVINRRNSRPPSGSGWRGWNSPIFATVRTNACARPARCTCSYPRYTTSVTVTWDSSIASRTSVATRSASPGSGVPPGRLNRVPVSCTNTRPAPSSSQPYTSRSQTVAIFTCLAMGSGQPPVTAVSGDQSRSAPTHAGSSHVYRLSGESSQTHWRSLEMLSPKRSR